MKTGWLILLGAVVLSGTGYFSSRLPRDRACTSCDVAQLKSADALAWMRRDFDLSDDEFVKVCALHDAYLPLCDSMCKRMEEATTHLASALQTSHSMTKEAEAALREYETARAECQRATLQHVLDTSAVMKPKAGGEFVQKILPHLLTSSQHVSELHHSRSQP